MKQNYRPFSWEEYVKNPELLRTRDGREVKQLTRLDAKDWPIVGVLDGVVEKWKKSGAFNTYLYIGCDHDLVLLKQPTETKKVKIVIHDNPTNTVIAEIFCDGVEVIEGKQIKYK